MPEYSYECQNKECEFNFDIIHSIKSDPLKKCPKCNKLTLIRLISDNINIRIKRDQSYYKKQERQEMRQYRKRTTEKLKEKYRNKKPWWRGEKIDMDVLKNPEKYIKTGET